jgi:uncharacterized protein (DUF934 family)|tara:strand:- start:3341 stop:3790 length:450 start_codon:yes stop_codon:yes gene_type:complete
MSALIEIDRIDGMLRGIDGPGADAVLLGPDAWQPGGEAGLLLGVDVEPEPRFAEASLIAIEFPVFHDGRGLSLAVLLRTRCGYTGELRAVGDVHPELIHYLRRCGFDSFLLPEGHRLSANDDRLAPYSDYYQASIVETLPAFRRDRRGV